MQKMFSVIREILGGSSWELCIYNGVNATSHRSTPYPCCVSALGGFRRSWSCDAHRSAKVACFFGSCKYFFLWDARFTPSLSAKSPSAPQNTVQNAAYRPPTLHFE